MRYGIIVVLVFVGVGCGIDSADVPSGLGKEGMLVLFQKEKRMEVWQGAGGKWSVHRSYSISFVEEWPLGVFDLRQVEGGVWIHWSNGFYRRKGRVDPQAQRILAEKPANLLSLLEAAEAEWLKNWMMGREDVKAVVCPNDGRREGGFVPCMNCPRWTPELLGELEGWLGVGKVQVDE